MKFLKIEHVITYHDKMIDQFGGLHGIRDISLLESAMEMPKASAFGKDLHTTIYDKAAAYLFHIIKNHRFNDGNKRTGAFAACVFLTINHVNLVFENENFESLVVGVAEGKVDKQQVSVFFESAK